MSDLMTTGEFAEYQARLKRVEEIEKKYTELEDRVKVLEGALENLKEGLDKRIKEAIRKDKLDMGSRVGR